MNPFLTDYQEKCTKIIRLLTDDLGTIKTGRAKPSLIENLKVKVYGETWMEVRELASISAPDAQLLVVSPWDKSIMRDLERGIATSEMRLNPVIDGDIIRIAIPPLTEETRKDMVKLVHQKVESHKVMVRSERTNYKKKIEEMENTSGVSEDDVKRDLDQLQKITDETTGKLDEMAKTKETEIMTV